MFPWPLLLAALPLLAPSPHFALAIFEYEYEYENAEGFGTFLDYYWGANLEYGAPTLLSGALPPGAIHVPWNKPTFVAKGGYFWYNATVDDVVVQVLQTRGPFGGSFARHTHDIFNVDSGFTIRNGTYVAQVFQDVYT